MNKIQLLKNNEPKKYNIKTKNFKLKLDENNLVLVAKKLGWKGDGTKESPIIVNPESNLPLKLVLSKIQLYLTLRNLTLTSITLYHCSNILIEDCKVNTLILNRSQNNIVRKSSIIRIESFLSRANIFENNHIYDISNHRFEKMGYRIFLCFTLVLSGLMIYTGIRGLIIQEIHWVTFYLLIMGILVTSAVSYYFILYFNIRKLDPNIFQENSSLTGLNQLFSN
ncbi:MAG: hypothetical protein ACXAC5_18925 [Promethearchaeota archaeon]